jgi:hypothetical protein
VARSSGGWQLHDANRHRIRSHRVHGLVTRDKQGERPSETS